MRIAQESTAAAPALEQAACRCAMEPSPSGVGPRSGEAAARVLRPASLILNLSKDEQPTDARHRLACRPSPAGLILSLSKERPAAQDKGRGSRAQDEERGRARGAGAHLPMQNSRKIR